MKIRLSEVRAIVRDVLAEARDPATAMKKLLSLPSDTQFHDGRLTWRKKGGHAGGKVISRVVNAALDAGWEQDDSAAAGSPDGSTVGSGSRYRDAAGNMLRVHSSYGVTASSNWYSIEVRLAPNAVVEDEAAPAVTSQRSAKLPIRRRR